MDIRKQADDIATQLEHKTRMNLRYIFKQGFWLSTGQVISTISSFLLAIAYANLLPKEVYGSYKYVLSIFAVFASLSLPGIQTALIRAIAQGHDGSFKKALSSRMQWSVLSSIGLLAFAAYYWTTGSPELTIPFIIAATFLPIVEPFETYSAILVGKKEFKRSSIYWMVTKLITTALIIAALIFSNSLIVLFLAYFVPLAAIKIILTIKSIRLLKDKISTDPDLLKYGTHLTANNIIATISRYIDTFLIFNLLGTVELAIYSFALAPPDQIKNVLKHVHTIALPKFSARSFSSVRSQLYGKLFFYALFLIAISVIYIAIAPYLYTYIFPEYIDSVKLSQLFAISLIGIIAVVPQTLMESQQMTGKLYILNVLPACIQIFLLIILISNFGLLGAIIARIVGRFVTTITSLVLIHHQ